MKSNFHSVLRSWQKVLSGLLLITLTLGALAACAPKPPPAPSDASAPVGENLQAVHIAVGSTPGNLAYLAIDLAQSAGYFAEQGLAVQYDYFQGGTEAATALLAGDVDFAAGSIDQAIKAGAKGQEMKMVVSFFKLSGLTVLLRSDLKDQIKTIADFKGRKVGITTVGSATNVLAVYLATQAGIAKDEFEVVPVGGTSTFVAAMKNKQIEIGIASDPAAMQLISEGDAVSLLDLATEEGTRQIFDTGAYQFTGLLTTPAIIAEKPEIAQKVVNALVKANQFMASHTAEEIVAALPADIAKDKELYIKSLQHSKEALSEDGAISPEGIHNNLKSQVAFGTIDAQQEPEITLFYDMDFVNKALGLDNK